MAIESSTGSSESTAYEKLAAHYRRISHLSHACSVLQWDEAVVMAEAAGESRAAASATLQGIRHQLATEPRIGEWVAEARSRVGQLDAWQRANLDEIERSWTRATCLPSSLVEASSEAAIHCEQAWRRLRPDNDWTAFRPLLATVVDLQRECASALASQLSLSRYDALLDAYEPGTTADEIDQLFGPLREFLPEFTATVIDRQGARPSEGPQGAFAPDRQRELGLRLMRAVGFDASRGRLDVSHHPFCGGVPQDVRITTRYDEADFSKGLMAVLHETGHAMYEQGLPGAWLDQPVGSARSMGLHESQSLLREMQVARSREFLEYAAPIVREELGVSEGPGFAAEALYRSFTRVAPGLIRVDADEVTYPAHVILRYDIERQLVEGEIEVGDIPELWTASMRSLLGLDTTGDYANGCMQDVHWAAGLFGYFPTYTLGAMIAAQLFAAAARDLPDIRQRIGRGDFETLNAWLREKIWSRASSVGTRELLLDATGSELDPACFRAHLEARYLG